tara:strand:+ start:206348 stop:206785 length:438 start_codon:yes stop_codon:yes gene_type:complete
MSDWWNEKPLAALNPQEWEALCDGCAKCCLHKLQDEDTGKIHYTQVRCQYLDEDSCACSDYPNRSVMVPDCIHLERDTIDELGWLPSTCAYRLRSENKPLFAWHPLVSGDPESVHAAGISIRGRSLSEEFVHPDGMDEYIVHWVE